MKFAIVLASMFLMACQTTGTKSVGQMECYNMTTTVKNSHHEAGEPRTTTKQVCWVPGAMASPEVDSPVRFGKKGQSER